MVWLRVRRWVVRPIVWMFAIAAFALLALRAYVDSDAVRVQLAGILERELARVVGRAVSIGSLEFDLLPARLVVRDLVVPSDEPGSAPFLEAREVRVELDLDALRHDQIDLQTVSVTGLRVRIALRDEGDNLPDFPPSGAGGGRFSVRIGGLYVDDGEVELADARLPLDLSARAVLVRLAGLGGTVLQGNVTAQEVSTTLPGAEPWPATLSGKLRIENDRIEILAARVASAWLDARAEGTIGWRGGTHGEIRTRIDARGEWLDERGWLDGQIGGAFRYDGAIRFAKAELRFEGELSSPRTRLFGFELADLSGRVEGDPRRIEYAIRSARYEGAALSGQFVAELAGPEDRGHLDLRIDGAPVARVLSTLGLPPFRLASTAHGELTFDFPFSDVTSGAGAGAFEIRASSNASSDPLAVPAEGVLGLAIADGRLEIHEVALDAGSQEIAARGAYQLESGEGTFDVDVTSADLGELARLQPFVATEPPPLWLPEAGTGTIGVQARLARGGADADLRLELERVRAPGIAADRVTGSLTVSADAISDLDLLLERSTSRLQLTGSMPLGGASEDASGSSADLRIAFEGWPVEEVGPWAPVALPLSGPAHGELQLGGNLEALTGELFAYVSPVEIGPIAAERLDVALRWDPASLAISRALVTAPAGSLAASGTLRFEGGALDLRLATEGEGLDLGAPPFAAVWEDRLAGRLQLEGQIGGTLEAPAGEIEGTVRSMRLLGSEIGAENTTRFVARADQGRLDVDLTLPELVDIRGGGPFRPGERLDLEFDISTARLERWLHLASGIEIQGLSGAMHAEARIRQEGDEPLAAELVADRLDLQLRSRSLGLVEPARLRLDGERLRVESLYFADPAQRDELFAAGEIALDAGALDLNVQAAISADWVAEWTGFDLDGRFELLTRIGGTFAKPEWNGEAALHGGRLIPPRIPHSVDRVEALALLYPEAIVLDSARGEFAGGRLAAFGRIDLPRADRPLDYRFQLSMQDASVRYPTGFLLQGGAELTLQASNEGRQLRGEVDLERIDYLQDINLAPTQIIQRFLTRTRLQVDETDDTLASTYLNVAVEAPQALRVRNNLARLNGSVEMSVRGTLANPVLFGEIAIAEGGAITYGGNDYEVQRAVLTFANPSRIVPLIDFVATTDIDDYDVRLVVGGSLDRLTTTFSSNPPLSEYDVLALLTTGSTAGDEVFSGTGGGDTGSAALAAESLLYGQAAALIGARVGTLFGVDRLQIEPLTTGDTVSAARVTVGKRLSRRIYVTYSVDPSSTAQQILEVEWKLSEELTLVLTQNGDGSYAVDTRWERRF